MRILERDKAKRTTYKKAIKQWLKDRNSYNNGIIDKITEYVKRRGNSRPVYIKSPRI